MSEDARCAERFLCALFVTVVKPFSDLRLLISGLCALLFAFCLPAEAQQQAKIPKIGELVGFRRASTLGTGREIFRRSLRELGYVEGKSILYEDRSAEESLTDFPLWPTSWSVSELMYWSPLRRMRS